LVSKARVVEDALGASSIAAGALKVYLHYHSIWGSQSDPLDYVLGACGVAAGSALILVATWPSVRARTGILATLFVIALTGAKAVTDIPDLPDILLCLLIGSTAAILLYEALRDETRALPPR
jgi:hypothetical protein